MDLLNSCVITEGFQKIDGHLFSGCVGKILQNPMVDILMAFKSSVMITKNCGRGFPAPNVPWGGTGWRALGAISLEESVNEAPAGSMTASVGARLGCVWERGADCRRSPACTRGGNVAAMLADPGKGKGMDPAPCPLGLGRAIPARPAVPEMRRGPGRRDGCCVRCHFVPPALSPWAAVGICQTAPWFRGHLQSTSSRGWGFA